MSLNLKTGQIIKFSLTTVCALDRSVAAALYAIQLPNIVSATVVGFHREGRESFVAVDIPGAGACAIGSRVLETAMEAVE